MSEFRQDIVTKEWVLIAPSRNTRPQEFKQEALVSEPLPEVLESCVFCPGNEHMSAEQIARYPKMGGWKIRIVPNKFALLGLREGVPQRNFYVTLPGIGSHEVLITRLHNTPVALQPVELIDSTLGAYIERINEFSTYDPIRYVHVIQNHGRAAGASIIHPHSQIIAMPFPGPHLMEELRGSSHHYDIFDQCIYCEINLHEKKEGVRVVMETEHFLAMCPFESKMPYQVRIVPKRHEARFNTISKAERNDLAYVIKNILTKLYNKLDNPAYNYYFHTLPFPRSTNALNNEKAYHWHMVIMPRTNIWAGLELGTEVYVNVMPPEEAAEFLRS